MKTLILSTLLVSILLISSSCDHTNGVGSSSTSNSTREAVSSGSWRVTLFSERGNDETNDFAGYTFTFSSDGSISAVKSGVTTTGTWSTSQGSNSAKFNINLGPKTDANKPLGELTDDWKILSNTTTEVRLTDDNATSSEFLSFSKN